VGVPVIAALAAMHGMVPPHPGPLTAIATLHTTVGPTMLYGFLAVIPAMVLGGPLYGAFITPRMSTRPDAALLEQFTSGKKEGGEGSAPSIGMGVLCALLPALLMLVHALAEVLLPKDSGLLHAAAFLGNPLVAMLLGVVFASITLGYLRGADAEKLRDALGQSLKPIAGIMLIIAGGGAFQQILTSAKVGDAIVHMTQQFALPPLVLGWMIAMLLSVSTGSATVGIVGAAGLLAPLAASDPSLNVPLLALAIGCGSLFFNYANHAGFWMVKESFGMSMGEATKTITVVQSIVSFVGLLMVLLFNLLPKLGLVKGMSERHEAGRLRPLRCRHNHQERALLPVRLRIAPVATGKMPSRTGAVAGAASTRGRQFTYTDGGAVLVVRLLSARLTPSRSPGCR
jgi:GntP family gluconate:H+ symporter